MLWTATGAQGGYMRYVSTSATSVYVYVVMFGGQQGLWALNACVIALLLTCGCSQRGSDFVRRLSIILNGLAMVLCFVLSGLFRNFRKDSTILSIITALILYNA
ncbi:uncharacterized protein EV420DRAFT_1560669 [Desarmillaria tabescens]|uniref:Uncharacterized protein n=1 Tax=Armillaria tabescens TaxID=1929756 RepID=A0AA39K0Z2_ARMTA|nr:uncharacterized protein EV420DRAFT_1560669 [Desarmillaria tabescens]KAK0451376.1 hypothetical protein EV420DRAFT_1560669 [Desarmillaria tabescens]